MKVLVVIPARYASTRFPGKPLTLLTGPDGVKKSLIQRTWETAQKIAVADRIVVATDDDRIAEVAHAFGAEVVMTSDTCRNGTERCAEVAAQIGAGYDLIVNLQGDAPLTPPWFIDALIDGLDQTPWAVMATPVLQCDGDTLAALRNDRAHGRVGGTTAVFASNGRALYFSKEVIPYTSAEFTPSAKTPIFHHVGVYAYRSDALKNYVNHEECELERLEGLEQLRFLESELPVLCVPVDARGHQFWELNNPSDVERIETILQSSGIA